MKNSLYTGALLLSAICFSCSINNVLEPSDDVKIAIMETVDTVRTVPGDTVSFKFIASTSKGALKRIEISGQEGNFTPLTDSVKFALVDQNIELTIDDQGYLSRPVSTVMMIYPVIMDNNTSMLGQMVGVTFRITNDSGKSGDANIRFQVVNYRGYTTWTWFYKYFEKKSGTCFYDPYNHKSYSATTFEKAKDKVELVAVSDANGVNYCVDPKLPETEALLKADGFSYQASEMHETVMYKVNGVDFDSFVDSDFDKLDFSQALHKVTMEQDDIIAFRSSNGRKGILNIKIQNNFPMVQCKYQAIAK